MTSDRPLISVCIPAYNRARHLTALLDSIFSQDFTDFDVVICEDCSPERATIAEIAAGFASRFPSRIHYIENEKNLGYDGNIRRLVECAKGKFCFFMGNDDIMCAGALSTVADIIHRYPEVGLVLKSYAWFDNTLENINQEIRYFAEERVFAAGQQAITVCYRRAGVISGFVIRRDPAYAAATDRFDGTLYYQMHLTAQVLSTHPAVFTPKVLVLCRNGEPPDFGNSNTEKGKYVPGTYTVQARHNMVQGALKIIKHLKADRGIDVVDEVQRDYANYFYVYIKDQLTLPPRKFFSLYWGYGRMGFFKYPMFHLYCFAAYLLGEKRFDQSTKKIRQYLGRSPQFGSIGK